MMPANRNTHTFDVELACVVGIEKAILLGNIWFWVTEMKAKKSKAHFKDGKYWTYDTAKGLARKYPYMKEKSIDRWIKDLETAKWIEKDKFNDENLNRTNWYTVGEKLALFYNSPIPQNEESTETEPAPIPQNEECIPQNEESEAKNQALEPETTPSIPQNEGSNPQNEEWKSQNEGCIPQNEESASIYKDTDIKPTDNSTDTNSIVKLTADAVKARDGFESGVVDLPQTTTPLPVTPPPEAAKKPQVVYGDGELQRNCREYLKANPNQYPTEMYIDFMMYWTAPVINGKKSDIGKERWRTEKTWLLAGRLSTWHQKYLNIQKRAIHPTHHQRITEPIKNGGFGAL